MVSSGSKIPSQQRNYSFRGTFTHALDDKGRISLPAAFRDTLDSRRQASLVVTNFISQGARCLEAYPVDVWEELEAKLLRKSRFDPKLKQLENFYFSRACECSVDGNGRIKIPTHLIQYAGITKQVVFASVLDGFRIWDERVFELVFREAEQALLENPELFANIDLERDLKR
ncbi:division/cell wall cluster transcriptional repressor MraZ [bacterium]|nr:division/cell wall cluster transcriptional repressor MraZ [bacterium]